MKHRSILLLSLIFIAGNIIAQQNSLWLTNGKKLTISDYKIWQEESGDSVFNYTSSKGKDKQVYLDEVFSIIDNTGNENVIYHSNIAIGEVLTVEQMRSYVNGRYDGSQTKVSPWVAVSAGVLGVGSAFIPSPSIKSADIPVGVIIPFAHATVVGAFATPDKVLNKKFPEKINDEFYIMGVDQSLRKKRIRNSLIAGVAGFIAGTIVVYSVN